MILWKKILGCNIHNNKLFSSKNKERFENTFTKLKTFILKTFTNINLSKDKMIQKFLPP